MEKIAIKWRFHRPSSIYRYALFLHKETRYRKNGFFYDLVIDSFSIVISV